MSGFDAFLELKFQRIKFIELSDLIMQKYGTIFIQIQSINHTEAFTREKFLYDEQFLDSNRHIGLVSFTRKTSAKSLNFLRMLLIINLIDIDSRCFLQTFKAS